MSPKEQKNIFVDKRGTRLKPKKRQNIDILIVIVATYLLHREIASSSPARSSIHNQYVIPGLTGDLSQQTQINPLIERYFHKSGLISFQITPYTKLR